MSLVRRTCTGELRLYIGRIRPSAARWGHNTTINLIEGDRGDDDHTNSDVAITFDSKVGEGQRCNELVTIAAEEGE